jgi:hypothetical protein
MAITVKHSKVSTIPDEADTSLVRPSDWNADHTLTGTIDIANGGTGQTTANAAFNALVPSQTGNTGKYLTTDGTDTSWATNPLGTVTSVNLTASTGISVSGGPITTSGSITVTNTAPDQTVVLNSGTGISTSGTYPNFTVTNTAPDQTVGIASGTGISVTGTYPNFTVTNTSPSSGGTVTSVSGTAPVNVANGTTTPVISLSTTGTGNVVLDTGATQANPTISNYENFTPTTAPTYSEGRVWYDSSEKALAYYNDSSSIAVHISQDLIFKVINNTGSTIPNGSPVYVTGTSSGQTYPNVALAKADVAATSAVIGLTNGAIANGAIGYVTSQGTIDNVNTGSFTVGQVLYLSPYSAGQLMNTIPPTGITVQVGVATFINSSTGHIYVKQTTPLAVPASIITGTLGVSNGGTGATTLTGYVKGSGTSALTASGTIPTTDLSGTVSNAQLANSAITINGTSTSLGGSISVGTVTSVTGTAPVVSSGGATPAISMAQSSTTVDGYLSATDFTTFNNKGNGTVTSVAALTLGTSGTDLSSTVANGTTTPVITLQVPTASATNRGALSSADWTTFNSKAAPFTYTSTYIPFGQGTTTPNQSANLTFDGTSLTAPVQRASNGIVTNNKTIGTSFTIPSTDNAMSSGPVTLSAGVTVTVSSGSRWVVL